ncbi:MAG: hypothetical protein KDJ54_08820 [Candidatus Competibacteraceae bacterium]|nr:hypothetical protein [Candidatus Competibacteraceae bacterium]
MSLYYDFRRTTFKNYCLIKKGDYFTDPVGLDVESITPGAYYLEITPVVGKVLKYYKNNPRGGWTSFYFNGEGLDDKGQYIPRLRGRYKFKLVNAAPGTRNILQGTLTYG